MDILEKIDILRKERGWSVNYLDMEAGLTQSTLNNLYLRHSEPRIVTLQAICNAFGITISDFFKEQEDCEPDAELIRLVKRLSPDNKEALKKLLKSIK